MENITGLHLPGFTDENVTLLRQNGSIIKVFPSLIIDRFVNMDTVVLSDVAMTSFGQPITNCVNLDSVTLANGEITYIPQGIFRNCAKMKKLTISNHPIQKISFYAFSGLVGLHYLTIDGANLQTLSPVVIYPMTELVELELKNNKITRISGVFPQLEQMRFLRLSNNNLTTWNPAFLSANPQLRGLYLDHNEIRSLTADAFANLPELTYLSVGDNLSQLPVFENLVKLEILKIERCPLTHVSGASFQNMASLMQLQLPGNQISSLNFMAPTPAILQRLTYLDLSNNRIAEIPNFAFGALTGLNKLNLQDNFITRLNRSSLRPVINVIATLDLRFNPIRVIESRLFDDVTELNIMMEGGCHYGRVELGPDLQSSNADFIKNCLSFEINQKENL